MIKRIQMDTNINYFEQSIFCYKAYISKALDAILEKYGAKKVLLVRGGKSFSACGAEEEVAKLREKYEIVEFRDFSVNPKKEDAVRGAEVLKEQGCDVILSVGGGSAIDTAKLIKYFACGEFKDMSEGDTEVAIPHIAVPTTAGTGAESTQFAVCYVNGVKTSISNPKLLPDKAIICPDFTYGNGAYLTACTGFDALAQAFEAYWSVNATAESDVYALQAILIANKALPLLMEEIQAEGAKNSSHTLRDLLSKASNLAGQAINITRTTAPHAMSYTLTSKFGYPHGHAVALTFPYFFFVNINCEEENYLGKDYIQYKSKMSSLLNLLSLKSESLYAYMKEYTKGIGLGFDPQRPVDTAMVAAGVNAERAKNNPMRLTEEILKAAAAQITE